MKKRISLLALMLIVAMGIQAQSLIGTWKTNTEIDEDGDATSWAFTFKKDNTMSLKMIMASSDPDVGSFEFSLVIPGTYKRSGNTITLNLNPGKSTAKIDKMIFSGEMASLVNDNPEMKKTVMDMLQKQVDEELKKNLSNELPFGDDVTIVSLTSTTLELESGDDTLKFTRAYK